MLNSGDLNPMRTPTESASETDASRTFSSDPDSVAFSDSSLQEHLHEQMDLSKDCRPSLMTRCLSGFRQVTAFVFGTISFFIGSFCLVLVLAILAAVPGLNILVLGYLVEAQRRVAMSGRLRDGFPLLVFAPRLSVIATFIFLMLLPIRIQATRISNAIVVLGETAPQVEQMKLILLVLQCLLFVHLTAALTNGGRVRCFLRPIRNFRLLLRRTLTRAGRESLKTDLAAVIHVLNPLSHFFLGLKAMIGAAVWLLIPAGLLVTYSRPDHDRPVYGVLAAAGVLLMVLVTAWLPLLQVHMAVSGRFTSVFSAGTARKIIRSSPFSWLVMTVLLYGMTFPLYLTRIRLPPADAVFVLTPAFIVLIYPARLLVAWVYYRGVHRNRETPWQIHLPVRMFMLPVLGAYAFLLFLTPYVSELGRAAPIENSAFFSPVPAVGFFSSSRN